MRKMNMAVELARLAPRPGLARVNGIELKLGKFRGRFPWHRHAGEDELFRVVRGSLRIEFRDREVVLGEGDLLVVPMGVEHRSIAEADAHVIVMHPETTKLPGPPEAAG